jgi:beta-lactamase regulating signal transducer with metallopeptidase domain
MITLTLGTSTLVVVVVNLSATASILAGVWTAGIVGALAVLASISLLANASEKEQTGVKDRCISNQQQQQQQQQQRWKITVSKFPAVAST